MTGKILKAKGVLYLQVEGGGSWTLNSIKDALSDPEFWDRNSELADLLYTAQASMEADETGEIDSANVDNLD